MFARRPVSLAHERLLLAKTAESALSLVLAEGVLAVAPNLAAWAGREPAAARTITAALRDEGAWTALIDDWAAVGPALARLAAHAVREPQAFTLAPLSDTKLLPPLPSPTTRIFALGSNFARHVLDANTAIHGAARARELLEERRSLGPSGFHVLPDTVVGHNAEVIPPAGIERLDYEGEVAVVLARGGRALAPADVAIWGFTAWNDFSLRDTLFRLGAPYDRGSMSWALQKNFETGSSAGPWVAIDPQAQIDAVPIVLRVNGEERQCGSTAEMIFSFAETAAHLSRFLTLRAGDVIVSGTPAGTVLESGDTGDYLAPGDTIELEVGGLAALRNTIGPAAAPGDQGPTRRRGAAPAPRRQA